MTARIRKWGRSLAGRIRKLMIAPAPADYNLDDLLGNVTAANVYGETDTGMPLGREVW